jgi:Histidine kinase-, DNA gyrase B-, and HSP90-like ATPase
MMRSAKSASRLVAKLSIIGWNAEQARATMAVQEILFDERFLPRHAGAIMSEPDVALVELVANAWDAYATRVDITWPHPETGLPFAIQDDGCGMTPEQFDERWKTLDYNRVDAQGSAVMAPPELSGKSPRTAFGRNGKGRYAAFLFASRYRLRTWCDGLESTFEVSRETSQPLVVSLIGRREPAEGHGTEIVAIASRPVRLSAEQARIVLGTRFLMDPSFEVTIDGIPVTFDDIPKTMVKDSRVDVPSHGTARVRMIDTSRSDRTKGQHGIAWWVVNRLVGECSWRGFNDELILDGRTAAARRYMFIVFADFLADAVCTDWRAFDGDHEAWKAARPLVQDCIRSLLADATSAQRSEVKDSIRDRHHDSVRRMAPASRERWNAFIEQVVDSCPSLPEQQIEQVAGVLANLEISKSKYGLINKLHDMQPGDLDNLHQLLEDWTLEVAKDALDEIQARLRLIEELDTKLRDPESDEVQDLQPLLESSLWAFGPEFESIEYTSNRGMTEVIRSLFGAPTRGSRSRPDFVIVPDGSLGLYSRDAYGEDREVNGLASLVVVEIKRPGVRIGSDQKNQVWKYVKELIEKGFIDERTRVNCFVLGSERDPHETTRDEGRVIIEPMTYDIFIRRAERRMLGLREKLKSAPFLQQHGLNAEDYITPPRPSRPDLFTVA